MITSPYEALKLEYAGFLSTAGRRSFAINESSENGPGPKSRISNAANQNV
jgi:hypothetical protein